MSKELSKWWTCGLRDDIFWRSSQSGGRATIRSRKGQTTHGSYGDIIALDPIGEPLLRLWTIELKRGANHGHPSVLIDKCSDVIQPFAQAVQKAVRSAREARSKGWMLISRHNHCLEMVYVDWDTFCMIPHMRKPPCVAYSVQIGKETHTFLGIPLRDFFKRVRPEDVEDAVERLPSKIIP